MRFVVVCSVGRSGTTLLQGILNSIDGYCVRGENKNFLLGLYLSYESLRYAHHQSRPGHSPLYAWYGSEKLDPARFLSDARTLVLDQLALPPDTVVGGFKEIRWTRSHLPGVSLEDYMDFIARLFGDVKFIFLSRNPSEIVDSQVRARFKIYDMDERVRISKIERFYAEICAVKLPVFEIDYREIIEPTPRLRSMFEFIGAEYDEDRLNAVLSVPYGYAQSKETLTEIKARAAARRRPEET